METGFRNYKFSSAVSCLIYIRSEGITYLKVYLTLQKYNMSVCLMNLKFEPDLVNLSEIQPKHKFGSDNETMKTESECDLGLTAFTKRQSEVVTDNVILSQIRL